MCSIGLEEKLKIRYSEMDCDLVLKPAVLLQFLQDLASDNAENLGFGYSFTSKNNLGWFLLKYHFEFDNYPEGLYDINIYTEPRGCNKMFAFRDFEIRSEDKILGRACTTWALVDLTTKNIVSPIEFISKLENLKPYEKKENDFAYLKIRQPQKIDTKKTFDIRFDDLDVNKHVNNSNYIVWAFETLNYDFRRTKKLKTLDIVFKKEVQYGVPILSQTEIKDDITVHVIKNANTDEELCLIMAQWIDKTVF